MIKKLIMIGGCIASFNLFAQCQINGELNLAVGKEYTFSVDKKLAQCEDCHHWLVKKEDFKIISETKKNEIKIIPTKTGTYEISAAVIASNGLQNCQTTVNVHEYTEEKVAPKENDCKLTVTDFKEIRVDPTTVLLYPNNRNLTYNYTWEITYKNGKTTLISDIAPTVSRAVNNEIKTVVMRVLSATCVRTFTKNYDDTFWKYY